VHEHVRVADYP